MDASFYLSINQYMRQHPRLLSAVRMLDVAISLAVFLSYPVFLGWAFFHRPQDLLKVILTLKVEPQLKMSYL